MKISGHPNLNKDSMTGAVVNTDKNAFEAYKRQRALALQSSTNAEDLVHLKQEIDEMKALLKEVLSKL
jgi:hypothetical protein|tara:strand:- start:18 stop:221 length:204 start_codon:yes stop_codon:yes gene_type:complete